MIAHDVVIEGVGRFINMTDKELNVGHIEDGKFVKDYTFKPSGQVARAIEITGKSGLAGKVQIMHNYRTVKNLLYPQEGVFLIVNYYVRMALPRRSDLLSPGRPFRDESGKIVGVEGLYCNNQNREKK